MSLEYFNPLSPIPTKWSKMLLPTNCLSVFDHFVGLGLKAYSNLKKLNSRTFREFQGHHSIFSRTAEGKMQGCFQEIELKRKSIKEISGPELT